MSMTKQEIFDTVIAHMRKQKATSMRGLICAYRGADGNQCAVGCLIKDEEYKASWDAGAGVNLYHILRECQSFAERMGFTPRIDPNWIEKFLSDLQTIHDLHEVSDWEGRFQSLSERWNLTYTAPST